MCDSQAMTSAQKAIGDFAPKLVSLTDDVLFGDVWERTVCPSESAWSLKRHNAARRPGAPRHSELGRFRKIG